MLIITRKAGTETGNTVYHHSEEGQTAIRVLGVQGKQVRIGIDAPNGVDIWRDDRKESKKVEE